MKPYLHSIKPTRIIPVFSLLCPQKITFLSHPFLNLAFKPHVYGQNGSLIRTLSSRAFRAGPGVGAQRSLVDDEADLSDFVGGLGSDDYLKKTRGRVYSDSDNENGRGGERGMQGRGRGRGRSSRGGGGRFSGGMRSRDDESDMDEGGYRRGGGRGGRVFSGRGRGGRSSNMSSSEDESDMDERGYRGSRGGGRFGGRDEVSRFERGGRGGGEMRRGGRSDMRGGREMRGGRSGMGRGGMRSEDKVRRRDFASSRGRGDKDGVRRGGMRTTGIRTENLSALSDDNDDSEIDEEEDDWINEAEDDETGEDDDDDDIYEEEAGVLVNKESDLGRKTSIPSSSSGGDSYLTETRFDQCSVSPLLMKALKNAGYEKMTVVQEATLPVILKGKDVLAKARTGTGKTVAFLLPSIDIVEKTPAASRDQRLQPILVLVICPTRELACQAAAEAKKLLKYHPSLGVQVVIGGTRLTAEQKRMQANPCQIIVATPGRLKDHIENTTGFAPRLQGIKVLVLDEADHLLDMGFRRDIERIIAAIPKQRQTLLFSATIPPEVKQICHVALRKDYEYVNTVQEGSEETHTQVRQTHLVATLDNHFPLLYTLLKDHIADNVDYKVLVFCTTAMVTRLVAELLNELKLNVREIHSRKSQSYRTKVSDEFRQSKSLILVTSDVSARGVDYPDVTFVVQLGLPADKQQYIHRLGRTGRKGKEGEGVLLLAPWEEFFLSSIKDIPITKAAVPLLDPESKKKVASAMSRIGMKERESAYQAWLGYYNSNKNVGKDKTRLVQLANEFSRTMELDSPPAIPKMILGKMGLKNVPGLRTK